MARRQPSAQSDQEMQLEMFAVFMMMCLTLTWDFVVGEGVRLTVVRAGRRASL